MTQEDEERYRAKNNCRFCKKTDRIRDPCHLTCKYRGPAHNKCNINVTQKQTFLFQLSFTVLRTMIAIFFDKLVDKKIDKVKFDLNFRQMKKRFQ